MDDTPTSFVSEMTDLYDSYDVWFIPFWQKPLFRVFAIIVLISVLIVLSIVVVRFINKRLPKSDSPPWIVALEELSSLQNNTHKKQAQQESYFVVTSIIKKYLQDRYYISVLDKTDRQMMEYVSSIDMPPALQHDLYDIFERAVSIKFAQETVSEKDMQHDITKVHDFINATIPHDISQKA